MRDGASLTLGGGTFNTSDVTAGGGGGGSGSGAQAGSDLFLMSGTTTTFNPGDGQTLAFNGTIADDSAGSLPGGTYTAGTGTGAQIFISGTGTVVYTASHTYSYSGATTVSNGLLRVEGTVNNSAITVSGIGTLDGTGTVNAVRVLEGGTLAPGSNGVGTIHTGNVTFTDVSDPLVPAGTLAIQLGGTLQSQRDLLQVIGTVDLTGAHFSGFLTGGFDPANFTNYTIIDNDGAAADPVIGTFVGVAEGGTVGASGRAFSVSYVGGDGNDVVLTALGNGPPALIGLDPSVTFPENTVNATPQIIDNDVGFTDVEGNFNGGTLTVTGLLAEDVVSLNQTGFDPGQFFIDANRVLFEGIDIGGISGGSGGTLTITFNGDATSNAIDALIQNLTYANASGNPTISRMLTVTVTDAAAASTGGIPITVNVTAENDAPELLGVNATPTYNENGPALVLDNTLVVSDVDDTNIESATVTITDFVAGDVLNANTSGPNMALTYANGVLTLLGSRSKADYQEVLKTVTFSSTSNDPAVGGTNPDRVISWLISDGTDSNSPVPALTLNVNAINDAPVNTVPGPQTTNRNTDHAITGLAISDADLGANNITVTLHVDHGLLDIRTDVAGGLTAAGVSGNTTANVALAGTLNAINATLGASSGLIYHADTNFIGPDTLTVTSDDGGSTGTGGPLQGIATVAIQVIVKSSFALPGNWTSEEPFPGQGGWYVGDFNGDGLDDIFREHDGVSGAEVFTSNGTSFVGGSSWTGAGNDAQGWYVGDFDGDNRDDIFRYNEAVSGAEVFLSNGSSFGAGASWTGAGNDGRWYIGDFNGDGRDDIFRYNPGVSGAEVFLSNGSAFVFDGSWASAGTGTDGTWHVGDFNGDGNDDIFRYLEGQSGADMFLSNGSSGFVHDQSWTPAGFGSDGRWYVGDFNGDGTDDIFRYLAGTSGAQVFLSNGTEFVQDQSWTPAGFGSDDRWYVGDFNGDNTSDIFRNLTGQGAEVLL